YRQGDLRGHWRWVCQRSEGEGRDPGGEGRRDRPDKRSRSPGRRGACGRTAGGVGTRGFWGRGGGWLVGDAWAVRHVRVDLVPAQRVACCVLREKQCLEFDRLLKVLRGP